MFIYSFIYEQRVKNVKNKNFQHYDVIFWLKEKERSFHGDGVPSERAEFASVQQRCYVDLCYPLQFGTRLYLSLKL